MSIKLLNTNDVEELHLKGYRLLDIRHPDIFALAHIPGSLNVFMNADFEKNLARFLFKDVAILLITESGDEKNGLQQIEKMGYNNIRGVLNGGFNIWAKEKRPVDVVISILPDELNLEVKHGKLYVYDIRIMTEYDKFHFENSEQIKAETLIKDYEMIENDEFSCIICPDGVLSMSLISYLKINGKYNLYHATGGMNEIRKVKSITLVSSPQNN